MKKIAIGIALLLAGCTDEPNALRILRNEGMTKIEMTGYAAFACGERDTYATGFRAINAHGKLVTGTVCSGVLKGFTIRYD